MALNTADAAPVEERLSMWDLMKTRGEKRNDELVGGGEFAVTAELVESGSVMRIDEAQIKDQNRR